MFKALTLNEGEEAEPDEERLGVVEHLKPRRFTASEPTAQILLFALHLNSLHLQWQRFQNCDARKTTVPWCPKEPQKHKDADTTQDTRDHKGKECHLLHLCQEIPITLNTSHPWLSRFCKSRELTISASICNNWRCTLVRIESAFALLQVVLH